MVTVPPGPLSSPALDVPRTQLIRSERSVIVAPVTRPSRPLVMPMFASLNGFVESNVPLVHARQVKTLRPDWLSAYVLRILWATPPFSTISPSGASEAETGVPSNWLLQKVLALVQYEVAVGEIKPVAPLIADFAGVLASLRNRLSVMGS